MQPLSIGNVITVAFHLYRSHFKQYFSLTFIAVLWSLIPIYGWAKLLTINAIISRLVFSELINKPESVNTVRSHVNPRMWTFLSTKILVLVILFITNIVLSIPQALIGGIIGTILQDNTAAINFIGSVVSLIGLAAYTWVYSRFFIPDLPLAIERNVDVKQAISRSWELTKGHVLRLQGIIIISFLIILPIIGLALIPFVFAGFSASQASNSAPVALVLSFILILLGLIALILTTVFVSSLWQAIKAVVYYDLLNRREGLDLKLRKRTT